MTTQAGAIKTFTREEVAKHNKEGDLWIIIDSIIYDVSKFAAIHPGGAEVLTDEDVAGKDATTVFFGLHRIEVLQRPQYARIRIGQVEGEKQRIHMPQPGDISRVPYAEASWLTKDYVTPYYNDSHRALQKELRAFIDEVVFPDAQRCEATAERYSADVMRQIADKKLNHMRLGPGEHLHGLTLMGGVKGEDYDHFHELIVKQEFSRVTAHGYSHGMNAGVTIGLPPVMNFAAEPLRSRVTEEVLSGKKTMALAVTEAFAGSDVAGLRTRATRSKDGKTWVIKGTKKWITNGLWADYFLLPARTYGGDKEDGLVSCFLVPRSAGLVTKPIPTSYSLAAGTAFVTLNNVQVPAENMIGPEGRGLYIVFSNFNHERWGMCCGGAVIGRLIIEECLLWASQRIIKGKPLLAQPVIRQKLAFMIAKTESVQAWLEHLTYQMCNMDYATQARVLAGPMGFLKMQSTHVNNEIITEAVQIFGGRGMTKTGMGKYIEHIQRTRRIDSVGGGAEEVLADLGVRQAMRSMPKDVRL